MTPFNFLDVQITKQYFLKTKTKKTKTKTWLQKTKKNYTKN